MRINPKEISIQFTRDADFWNFEALWRGRRVGYAYCSLQNGNLRISDIKVADALPIPWPFMNTFLVLIGILPRTMSFRKLGVGTQLMDHIVAKAKRFQARSVWGSVTNNDITATPYLLEWYRKRGFCVTDSDNHCIGAAEKKISMELTNN